MLHTEGACLTSSARSSSGEPSFKRFEEGSAADMSFLLTFNLEPERDLGIYYFFLFRLALVCAVPQILIMLNIGYTRQVPRKRAMNLSIVGLKRDVLDELSFIQECNNNQKKRFVAVLWQTKSS